MTATGLMAAPFPEPPGVIARLLDELRLAAAATDETEHESRRVAMLSRPWDPPSCPPEIRRNVYVWLDDVVAWINEDHTWRTDRVVPICWDLHPHIVHELATVACLRWEATFARTPEPLWRSGTGSRCPRSSGASSTGSARPAVRPGGTKPNPGGGRNAIYREGDEPARRRSRRWQDEESISRTHKVASRPRRPDRVAGVSTTVCRAHRARPVRSLPRATSVRELLGCGMR